MAHPTVRAINGQLSPPQTPQTRHVNPDRTPLSPSSTQKLPYRAQSSSPYSIPEEYDAAPDAHAVTAYDPRQQAFAAEQEEEARQRGYVASQYPEPTPQRHQPHTFEAYPPAQYQQRTSSALPSQKMSDNQLAILAEAARKRKGHDFGPINLNGNGSAFAGNSYDDVRYVGFLADHRYKSITAGEKWTGQLLTGDHHVNVAGDFLNHPSKIAPQPPRGAPPVQSQQQQYYANGEPDFR